MHEIKAVIWGFKLETSKMEDKGVQLDYNYASSKNDYNSGIP